MKVTSTTLTLLQSLLLDLEEQCSTVGSSRDFETVKSRVECEGISFLTITLPGFVDNLFNCIEKDQVDSTDFLGFRKTGCLPSFLKGFTSLIFDQKSGRSLDDSQQKTLAIMSVRQIGYLYKKIKMPCTGPRVAKAIKGYQQTDNALKRHLFDKADFQLFDRVSRTIISSVFPVSIDEEDLIPHHGPGSTMEKLIGNRKYDYRKFSWYSQLDSSFSVGLNLAPSEEWESKGFTPDDKGGQPSVRVIHVPKTQKAPRIIAMEPVSMQFLQQGLKDYMVDRIERSRFTRGHVNFTYQSINRNLALRNSTSQSLATVDLSEASDRVHNEIVKRLFSVNPSLSKFIQATRSPVAQLGDSAVYLAKFASMGSALCFPVESLLFFTIAVMTGLEKVPPTTVSTKDIINSCRNVYVYGDDILIPSTQVESFSNLCNRFGLKVNRTKTFSRCKFRESCGMDAYNGCEITPIYMRVPLPKRHARIPHNDIVSLVATTNQFLAKEMRRTASILTKLVEQQIGELPNVGPRCEGLGWVDYTETSKRAKFRYNRNLQRREVQTLVPSISFKHDKIDGVPALLKCLLRLQKGFLEDQKNDRPKDKVESLYLSALATDKKHLSRTPVRGALTLKRRWVSLGN
jgi:hypothetical protein